ncbi:MAG: ADP-ribosylglycohydrolase family protein [Desulfovibrio sp.]|nr:ADP-ribosylglycohydrolase family protein [Desulfovibrio sp.]
MTDSRVCRGIGAIIGDIVGSPYEFDQGNKSEVFPLFSEASVPTDDSVLTLAVAEGLIRATGQGIEAARASVIASMVTWGRDYPYAGYGARFLGWLDDPVPYGSFGNGSAMRVSSAGWLFDTLGEVLAYAEMTAAVSHNHPEGIKGAQATAAAIFLTRTGMGKTDLKEYIHKTFEYDLSRSLAEIRPAYRHVETCQGTVPEAITAYLEGDSFEDVLRKAVSLGGDSDTLTAIAASIAEARYPVPAWIFKEAYARLDDRMRTALEEYQQFFGNRSIPVKAEKPHAEC